MAKTFKICCSNKCKKITRLIFFICLCICGVYHMGLFKIPVFMRKSMNFKYAEIAVGDLGVPVYYDRNHSHLVQESYKLYGYNQYISEKIGVARRLQDVRPRQCQKQILNKTSAKVSVIIVFYDEGWSTLMRTVYSLISTSPLDMLKEIILVDDNSSMNHLGKNLDVYIEKFKGRVKVVRSPVHGGLIAARLLGAKSATEDYLVFLTLPCEVTTGWLEPLIYPIFHNYRTVTCPTVDIIDHNTFQYKINREFNGETPIGSFDWNFYYTERPPTKEHIANGKSIIDPLPTPVMNGKFFAISMKWWKELGAYDPGLQISEGEQFELSFKVWMCGGSLLNIPCSRVGLVYRKPGFVRNDQGIYSRSPNYVNFNLKRVAEVWMDDYKQFLYTKRPDIAKVTNADKGIMDRKRLRNKNNCKSFRWYLENVVKDTLYTPYEPERTSNVIKNIKYKKCMKNNRGYRLFECNSSTIYQWTGIDEIRDNERCMTVKGNTLISDLCQENRGDQQFNYDNVTKQIISTEASLCVTANPSEHLVLEQCNKTNDSQKWDVKWKIFSITEPKSAQALHPPRQL